ncbi:glycosyltransferase family 4 protein [Halobacillus shinanisalinarum]|uniref:Glycosyltransferase family 4 protein n=1 Tax=Halobacillus shinanisalinarum TaxID=2932258 RepID=A0ABY4H1X8_9BACI|nr:glycosyltransferase family 4 protein [Halobacillus shinanisalinarum]UOQ94418.1 glycosyltransferase family 4 protein [Halobacillus shinanisalinarum]
MKVLHLNAGNETGGGMKHILSLLNELDHDQVVLGVFEDGEMVQRAQELGIETVHFKQAFPFDLSVVFQINRYIQQEKIDIVHTHGPRANVLMRLLKPKLQIPWVLTLHSDPDDDFIGHGVKGELFTRLHKRAIRSADHCMAISERFRKRLLQMNVPNHKITTIYNGIDFSKTPEMNWERKNFGFTEEDFLIAMVARFEPVKQHELAIEAFAAFKQRNENAHLLLIGDGTLENQLRKLCEKLEVDKSVHFLGFRNDVGALLPMVNLTLLTSKSESFPLVLLESARANVPAVTTDVGGVDQLIPSKGYGWIVDQSKSESIANALNQAALLNGSELQVIGERFRDFASNRYSTQHFADQVENVYDFLYKLPSKIGYNI